MYPKARALEAVPQELPQAIIKAVRENRVPELQGVPTETGVWVSQVPEQRGPQTGLERGPRLPGVPQHLEEHLLR